MRKKENCNEIESEGVTDRKKGKIGQDSKKNNVLETLTEDRARKPRCLLFQTMLISTILPPVQQS